MWSLFVKCHFLTGNYFFAYACFRRKKKLIGSPLYPGPNPQSRVRIASRRQQWGKTYEEDQALCFETANFCLEIYIVNISM